MQFEDNSTELAVSFNSKNTEHRTRGYLLFLSRCFQQIAWNVYTQVREILIVGIVEPELTKNFFRVHIFWMMPGHQLLRRVLLKRIRNHSARRFRRQPLPPKLRQ